MAWGTGSWGTRGWGADSPPPIPPPGPPTGLQRDPEPELRKLWGRDLFWDGDYEITPAGDWKVVDRELALTQAIRRRIMTSPGEWETLPDYGIGAQDFVKAPKTPSAIAELTDRIRTQLPRDPRIISVERVDVDTTVDGMLKISVKIIARARAEREEPMVIDVEVS